MKRVILTGWTGDYFEKIAQITVPLISKYAELHKVDFRCVDMAGNRPASWLKVQAIIDALGDYDQVTWIDSDVVIEKFDRSIFDELPSYAWQGLVVHQTDSGSIPNCGIWVLSKQMVPILKDAWSAGTNIYHPWWEQASILERMGYRVNYNTAEHTRMTPLYAHTFWLGSEWNHHPCDSQRVESPRFRHVTMYSDRLEAVATFAEISMINLERLGLV